jgi:hypothetical protein
MVVTVFTFHKLVIAKELEEQALRPVFGRCSERTMKATLNANSIKRLIDPVAAWDSILDRKVVSLRLIR